MSILATSLHQIIFPKAQKTSTFPVYFSFLTLCFIALINQPLKRVCLLTKTNTSRLNILLPLPSHFCLFIFVFLAFFPGIFFLMLTSSSSSLSEIFVYFMLGTWQLVPGILEIRMNPGSASWLSFHKAGGNMRVAVQLGQFIAFEVYQWEAGKKQSIFYLA